MEMSREMMRDAEMAAIAAIGQSYSQRAEAPLAATRDRVLSPPRAPAASAAGGCLRDTAMNSLPVQVRYTDPLVPMASLTFLKDNSILGDPDRGSGEETIRVPGSEADGQTTSCAVRYVHRTASGETTANASPFKCLVTPVRDGLSGESAELNSFRVAVPTSSKTSFCIPVQITYVPHMKLMGSFHIELSDRDGRTRACSQAFVILSKPPKNSFRTPKGRRFYIAKILSAAQETGCEVVDLRSPSGKRINTGPFRHLPWTGEGLKCVALPKEPWSGVVVTGTRTQAASAASPAGPRVLGEAEDEIRSLRRRVEALESIVRSLQGQIFGPSNSLAPVGSPGSFGMLSQGSASPGKRSRPDWFSAGQAE